MGWALALAVSLGVLGAVAILTLRGSKAPPVAPAAPMAAQGGGDAGVCPEVEAPIPRVLPSAEMVPVLVAGVGEVKPKIDGAFFESRPDAQKFLAPGPHLFSVDLDGVRLTLKFEVKPFHAALFHVEDSPGAGVPTVVYLGAPCTNCTVFPNPPLTPGGPVKRTDGEFPLALTAQALMTSDLETALAELKTAPQAERESTLFLRLWAHLQQATGQGPAALATLRMIPAPKSNGLAPLVSAWAKLDERERARETEVPLQRWNLTTERYSRFVDRFYGEAPGPLNTANARFNELTLAFTSASKAKDLARMQETLVAADAVVEKLVAALRSLRPGDCEFQRRVVAAF